MSGLERRPGIASRIVVRDVEGAGPSLSAVIEVGTTPYPVYLRASDGIPGGAADPFVPLTLLPALVLGADVRVEGAVTTETLAAAQRVQERFVRWFPALRPVRFEAARRRPARTRAPGVASLFSGGVDSFHTVLEGRDRITHLLFALGFDIPVGALGLGAKVSMALRAAAGELGLPLLEVETNLRLLLDPYVHWEFAHGTAIVAVAMRFGDRIGEFRIPSSGPDPGAWGTHVELDPLWTTPEQAFVHHAPALDRLAKLETLVGSATALRYLRVCWRNPAEAYNCGQCEKCLRTLAGLRSLGAEASATTFPGPLDLARVREVRVPDEVVLGSWRETREKAARNGDASLAAAIGAALRRDALLRTGESLRRFVAGVPGARALRQWLRRVRSHAAS